MANRSARPLLALVNAEVSGTIPVEGGCHIQAVWVQRYAFGSGRLAGTGWLRLPGCAVGHSAFRSAGGLMTAQFAKDIVRDHRNSPLLLLRLKLPWAVENQNVYPATGATPASRAAPARRQPARMTTRYSATKRMSGRAVGRTMVDAPISSPA